MNVNTLICVLAVALVTSGLTAAIGLHFWWIRHKRRGESSRGFPVGEKMPPSPPQQ